ncbi:PAN2-PAN3 deadenylation complex catalytic subunit PAN2 [Pelomyxa schiedti]|nr:PAN2-PAN3 deadenylation complex catalytic subunit PAN2 [Pelomyxa schiedti]
MCCTCLGISDSTVDRWEPTNATVESYCTPTSLIFDGTQEILWGGYQNGHVASLVCPTLDRYCSLQAHSSPVTCMADSSNGILTAGENSLRLFTRGGFPISSCLLSESPSYCIMMLPNSTKVVLSAGNTVSLLDIQTWQFLAKVSLEAPITAMCKGRNSVFCGNSCGWLTQLDTRIMRFDHVIELHSGAVCSLDTNSSLDLVSSCGYLTTTGHQTDRYIKIFDVRSKQHLQPLVFTPGAIKCAFEPLFPSSIIITGRDGIFKLCDAIGGGLNQTLFQVETNGEMLTSMAISSSGEAIAFSDTSGFIHLWSSSPTMRVNPFSEPLQFCKPISPANDEPLSQSYPPLDQPLLSDWGSTMSFPVNGPVFQLEPVLASTINKMDGFGYIKIGELSHLQHKALNAANPSLARKFKTTSLQPKRTRPPKMYRPVVSSRIRMSAIDKYDFDYSICNQTNFAGLDNNTPNSYTNSFLQVLYFIPQLRANLLNHLCHREFCLACELGFLFHMLDNAPSPGTCHSSRNFSRSLRQLPQATRLGLFDPLKPQPGTNSTSRKIDLPTLMENFCRFTLEQLNHELTTTEEAQPSIIDKLFGTSLVTHIRCLSCGSSSACPTRFFVIDLNMGRTTDPTKLKFTSLLPSSLCRTIQTKAWCDRCSQFQVLEQKKEVKGLPNILCVGVHMEANDELWRTILSNSGRGDSHGTFHTQDCSWLPRRLKIVLGSEISVTEYTGSDSGEDIYNLSAVICHVTDQVPSASRLGNLVAHVAVSQEYQKLHGYSQVEASQWFLFNDMAVAHCWPQQVVEFNTIWKHPCVVFYSSSLLHTKLPPESIVCPISEATFNSMRQSVLSSPRPISRPLVNVIPKPAQLVAIDAEFVALSTEKVALQVDGTRVVVSPTHLTPARISCVMGEGPFAGQPFLDDFVSTKDTIIDYLTKFSGIDPGDLDSSISMKNLTTLKAVYLKLRYLVDIGCRFIGHGLTKDFRILNIHVPKKQIIDTVELFHLRLHRNLSLKFLAAILLHVDVQTENHCSIEDAQTALALYNHYQQLSESGKLEHVLEEIYAYGKQSNWQYNLKETTGDPVSNP